MIIKTSEKQSKISNRTQMSTELRLDHEPQEKPQESCSRKPQKKIRIAAAATRGLVFTIITFDDGVGVKNPI